MGTRWVRVDRGSLSGWMDGPHVELIVTHHDTTHDTPRNTGLGKTLQAIACICYYRQLWPCLIVVPSSVRCVAKRDPTHPIHLPTPC